MFDQNVIAEDSSPVAMIDAKEIGVETQDSQVVVIEEKPQTTSQDDSNEEVERIELPDRKDLHAIDLENAIELQELAVASAYFPPYFQISEDGRIGAVGDLTGIDIINVSTGELIDHFTVELPISDFGIERCFQFNYDGSFLAVASKNDIQVWQIGGGLIYSIPYSRQFNTTDRIFGADIPQLALSPDGTLLIVSAVDFSSPSAGEYFHVINILNNEIIYEWNGTDEALHGSFYEFPGLGFSADGSVLQTFDPDKYAPLSGTAFEAFRFWSIDDGQELDPLSDVVEKAFTPDSLLFALQNEEELEIQDRRNGVKKYILRDTGCSFDYPCDVKLSTDGKYTALVDFSKETLSYRRDLIVKEFQIWDLVKGENIGEFQLNARNLDGVLLGGQGSYQIVQEGSTDSNSESIWWTSITNFAGLSLLEDGFTFSPQIVGLDSSDCYFCGTCEMNLNDMQIVCGQEYISHEGISYQLEDGQASEDASLSSDADAIDLPVEAGQNLTTRVLGISGEWQKVFYCVDQNQRQQECAFYDLEDEIILKSMEDIYALRFSFDGDYAAFIDREDKTLFIADLETGKVNEIGAYQSRAWPVNPAFSTSGTELVYMIQNVNSLDVLSLEWVDAADKRVIRRSNLENELFGEPTVLVWESKNELVALGNTDGWVYILDSENGKLLHTWQAETDEIIGLLFSRDGKLLITMGRAGIIRIWGVPKTD